MPSRISQMRSEQAQPQQMSQSPQINQEFINQLKTLMKSKNPIQYIEQVSTINPELGRILNMAKIGNGRAIYENLAYQFGVDPNWLLNQLLN